MQGLKESQILEMLNRYYKKTEKSLAETGLRIVARAYDNCKTHDNTVVGNICVMLSSLEDLKQQASPEGQACWGLFQGSGRKEQSIELSRKLASRALETFKAELKDHTEIQADEKFDEKNKFDPNVAKDWRVKRNPFLFHKLNYKDDSATVLEQQLKWALYNRKKWILVPKRISLNVRPGQVHICTKKIDYEICSWDPDREFKQRLVTLSEAQLEITTSAFTSAHGVTRNTQGCFSLSPEGHRLLQGNTKDVGCLQDFELIDNELDVIREKFTTQIRSSNIPVWAAFLSAEQLFEFKRAVNAKLENKQNSYGQVTSAMSTNAISTSAAVQRENKLSESAHYSLFENTEQYLQRAWAIGDRSFLKFYSYLLDDDFTWLLQRNIPAFNVLHQRLIQYNNECFSEPLDVRLEQVKIIKHYMMTHWVISNDKEQKKLLNTIVTKLHHEEYFLQYTATCLEHDPNIPDRLVTAKQLLQVMQPSFIRKHRGKLACATLACAAGIIVPPAIFGAIGLIGSGITVGVGGVGASVTYCKVNSANQTHQQLTQEAEAMCPMVLGKLREVAIETPLTREAYPEKTVEQEGRGDTKKAELKAERKLEKYLKKPLTVRQATIANFYKEIFAELEQNAQNLKTLDAEVQFTDGFELLIAESAFQEFIKNKDNSDARQGFVALLENIENKVPDVWNLVRAYDLGLEQRLKTIEALNQISFGMSL